MRHVGRRSTLAHLSHAREGGERAEQIIGRKVVGAAVCRIGRVEGGRWKVQGGMKALASDIFKLSVTCVLRNKLAEHSVAAA